ncbi:hypothetical protein TSOC_012286 [Tetrabaena socialis]|uniref:Uncharacterized protein n=1 Tax=Tetrabaena socialis TaxID=47790 RepID=A0A2J7ZNG7_9CHLO|nr:hypothetical protein TSOC_012286 [Tetrabaena socialis]|eukprot:PNH01807.1 hypothetical protein TSOC_012286 [Tetrabaena socialis]
MAVLAARSSTRRSDFSTIPKGTPPSHEAGCITSPEGTTLTPRTPGSYDLNHTLDQNEAADADEAAVASGMWTDGPHGRRALRSALSHALRLVAALRADNAGLRDQLALAQHALGERDQQLEDLRDACELYRSHNIALGDSISQLLANGAGQQLPNGSGSSCSIDPDAVPASDGGVRGQLCVRLFGSPASQPPTSRPGAYSWRRSLVPRADLGGDDGAAGSKAPVAGPQRQASYMPYIFEFEGSRPARDVSPPP